jgi:two-component system response regulator PilR (NtrC family)
MQVKLLRAIQEKRVRPVGGNAELPTDVRLLSATHKDLGLEVAAGRFREDLYFRINVIDLQVPSLRARREDIPLLAENIVARIARNHGVGAPELEAGALKALGAYSFPGNVRELENVLERACALCDGGQIRESDLQLSGGSRRIPAQDNRGGNRLAEVAGDLDAYLADIEREVLSEALEANRWNRTETAQSLGISFRSLRYRLKKLDMDS